MTSTVPTAHRRRSRRGHRPAAAAAPTTMPPRPAPATGNTGPARPAPASIAPAARFADLALPPALVQTLARRGMSAPFPIQAATIPDALAGRDLLGRAQTGSGKTLAFGLPLLARTAGQRAAAGRPLALVLVPTRELAQQVTAELAPYAGSVGVRCATVVGGLSIHRQAAALQAGAEVLVATPGRLADLVDRGECRLDRVAIAVVDEADQMADIGFLPQVTALLRQIPAGGQRMLFSATLGREVDRLVGRFLVDPVTHRVDPPGGTVATMTHHVLQVEDVDKQATVAEIAARDGRVLLFVETKRGADRLARQLTGRGLEVAALHGGKSQAQRTRALDRFRAGTLRTLVATNVAARGIHVDDLDLVVNVDPPADGTRYVHRGGRTARAGRSGSVVTLVSPGQSRDVSRLLNAAGIRPVHLRVGPGHPDLIKITGARTPPGAPAATAPAGRPSVRYRTPRA